MEHLARPEEYCSKRARRCLPWAPRLVLAVVGSVLLSSTFGAMLADAGGAKDNYPAIIKDSADRRATAEREWRRMLDAYSVPQTPPDFYPITYTPRSLLGVSGGVRIVAAKGPDDAEEMALREAAKSFLARWRDLIGADPAGISLTSVTHSAGTLRFQYAQANYSFPIMGNYGQMSIAISDDGRLSQLDDRFIPVVDLPSRPTLDRDTAIGKVVGRTFKYSDPSGREQLASIADRNQVTVKQLTVIPIEKGDALEVHLAWEIIAGKSPSWTLYIDAVNGLELRVAPNFQT
jgi:hypothetical protein